MLIFMHAMFIIMLYLGSKLALNFRIRHKNKSYKVLVCYVVQRTKPSADQAGAWSDLWNTGNWYWFSDERWWVGDPVLPRMLTVV